MENSVFERNMMSLFLDKLIKTFVRSEFSTKCDSTTDRNKVIASLNDVNSFNEKKSILNNSNLLFHLSQIHVHEVSSSLFTTESSEVATSILPVASLEHPSVFVCTSPCSASSSVSALSQLSCDFWRSPQAVGDDEVDLGSVELGGVFTVFRSFASFILILDSASRSIAQSVALAEVASVPLHRPIVNSYSQ